MNEKFTPGPWAYGTTGERMRDDYSQPFGVHHLFTDETPNTGTLICGVFGDVRGGVAVAEANARLIAAAPELLAALQWYVDNDPNFADLDCGVGVSLPAGQARLNARAAIAKARGVV